MARRDREINIFNIAFLDVITGAMGAFVLLVVLLSPYVKRGQEVTQQNNNAQQAQQAQQDADEARKERDQAQQQLQQQTEQSAKQALDRAEQNIQQADQAMQTDDVEELKRLLAQARADLAEARKQLDALNQQLQQARQDLKAAQDENAALQQRLDRAVATVNSLGNQLQAATQQRDRANVEANAARQQAVALQDTLDHSSPIPTSWSIVDATALPGCGNVGFTSQVVPVINKLPEGFASAKEASDYVTRGLDSVSFVPISGGGPPFHRQFLVRTPPGVRVLFGVTAKSAPPPGCQVRAGLVFTVINGSANDTRIIPGGVTPLRDTRPVILFALPVPQGQAAAPTPDDISIWQKTTASSGASH